MGLIETLFGKAIDKRVNRQVANITQNTFNQNLNQLINNVQVTINSNGYDYTERGFEQVGAVYECVDLIVKKFVACPWIVYRIKSQKDYKKYLQLSENADTLGPALLAKSKALEEVSMPKIEKLLENPNPNPENEGDDMWELLAALFLLRGNAYLYGNAGNDTDRAAGRWSELWGVPSDMTITAGQNFMDPVVSYQMTNYLQNKSFPANQIKHFKTLNPRYDPSGQQRFGIPTLRAYLYSLDILRNADKEADKQVKNGGTIGLLNPENKEDNWGEEQMLQTGESLKSAYKSNDKLDRIVPVSIPLKWTQIGLAIADMKLLELSDAKADDIYRAFHIPLQFRNQDSATYNNLPVANRQLAYNAIAPICRKFSKGVTSFICKPYNTSQNTYIVEKDFMGLPELNDDMKTVAEWLEKSWDLTPNERREVKRWGRSPQPGMDEIWVDKKMVRMQDVMDGKIDQGPGSTSSATTPPAEPAKTYFENLKEL
jgi:HK97 family phage portal protein